MATSFLGLPNKKRNSETLTAIDVFYNMIDWDVEDQARGKLSKLDAVLAVPMFLYHVIRMLVKLPLSIVQVLTEFLPGLAEEACRIEMVNARNKSLSYYAAKTGYVIFDALHFIGRAITSPLKSVFVSLDKNSDDKKSDVDFSLTSELTSGLMYGIVFTTVLALVTPMAAIPIATLVYKLLLIGISSSGVFILGIGISALVSVLTEDDIVKPLLRTIGNACGLKTTSSNNDSNIRESAASMLKKMPPNQTKDSETEIESQNQSTKELPKKLESTNDLSKKSEPEAKKSEPEAKKSEPEIHSDSTNEFNPFF